MSLDIFPVLFAARYPDLVGKRVLVALSGGADSVALLHLLRAPELELEIEAAHVHHGVRGAEADDDAAFCERVCDELSLGFHLLHMGPANSRQAGREATWRGLRYALLEELAAHCGHEVIATGHQRDDVAEGVLVQLLRGGGPRALAGIAETTGKLVRPLLGWSRAEIVTWLRERGISWREDSSNTDLHHLRNLVRHRLLPSLEEASPGLRNHLVHLAEALARDDSFLSEQLVSSGSWIDPWAPDGGIPVTAIRALPAALRSRWLHAQAGRVGLSRVTRRQAELFESMIGREATGAVTLCGRWRIRVARGMLWLEPPAPPPPYRIELQHNVWIDLPYPGWRARFGPHGEPAPDPHWSFRIEGGSRPVVRSPRVNDMVEMHGKPVRVSKLLSRALPRHLRNAWPVCCENDRIQWIPGVWRGPEPATRTGDVVEVMRRERSSCVV